MSVLRQNANETQRAGRSRRKRGARKRRTVKRTATTGIRYSAEKIKVVSKDGKLRGDLFRKYKNGKLIDERFVTDEMIKDLIKKSEANFRDRGGKADAPAPAPATVVVQDGTTFGQSLKTGAASGIGLGIGLEFVDAIGDMFRGAFDD
jgi:hypothetical protein